MTKKTTPISEDVLNQIKQGEVHMHSDWYFGLLSTGFAVALAFTLGVAVYASNLMLLRLEIARGNTSPWLLGRYYLDVQHLPIGFLLLAIVAVGGVVYLLQHRSRYARELPAWSVILGVGVFVLCLGMVFSRSQLNTPLQRGPFRPFYEQPMRHPRPIERNQPPAL